jgi:hypothetical protein
MATVAKQNKLNKVSGSISIVMSVLGGISGLILLVIFFPLGIFILICSLVTFIVAARTANQWTGSCPYCGYSQVAAVGPGANCPSCKQRILLRGGSFFRLDELKGGA